MVNALLLAGATPACYGQIFNLGGNEPINLLNLIELLIDLNGGGEFEVVPFPADKKRIDIGDYYGDFRKFTDVTGWQPTTALRSGFAQMIAYYKQNSGRYLQTQP